MAKGQKITPIGDLGVGDEIMCFGFGCVIHRATRRIHAAPEGALHPGRSGASGLWVRCRWGWHPLGPDDMVKLQASASSLAAAKVARGQDQQRSLTNSGIKEGKE